MSIFLKLGNKSPLKLTNSLILSTIKCSTSSAAGTNFLSYDKDPGAAFLDPQTQKLLKSMTRLKLDRVYRKRAVLNNKVEYKFMTTEQIEDAIQSSIAKAHSLLQMPPIVEIEIDKHKIISNDPALQGYDNSMHIFTDITFGVPNWDRTIVVRQPDGKLESAGGEVRKRMNQIYFPNPGRRLRQPRLFEQEYLKPCMDQLNYEFILDRACVQFEPYEQEFHNVTQQVYLHINETKQFNLLRSTRHFGPMCFFLAWHRIIDNLLIDMIQRDYLSNGVELVCMMYRLNGVKYDESILTQVEKLTQKKADILAKNILAIGHGELQHDIEARIGKTVEDFAIDDVCFAFIEAFNKSNGIKKSKIEMSLHTYRELNDGKRRLLEGLHKAHGVS